MKKYIATSLLYFATCSFQTVAECSLASITDSLSKATLNASFVQEKKIAALNMPLRSYGKIWFSNSSQLVWQVNRPIKSTMVIMRDEITQFNRKDLRLENKSNIAPAGIAKLFHSIANGDLENLSEQFETQLNCQEQQWRLLLKPKGAPLNQLLSQLEIHGVHSVNAIQTFSYTEIRGDVTLVTLTHLEQSLSSELSWYLK
jgi:hypothetical protein